MAVLPTIKIKHGDGFMRINETDFDPNVHERWVDPEQADDAEGGDPDEVKDSNGGTDKGSPTSGPSAADKSVAAPKQSTGRAGRRKGK